MPWVEHSIIANVLTMLLRMAHDLRCELLYTNYFQTVVVSDESKPQMCVGSTILHLRPQTKSDQS